MPSTRSTGVELTNQSLSDLASALPVSHRPAGFVPPPGLGDHKSRMVAAREALRASPHFRARGGRFDAIPASFPLRIRPYPSTLNLPTTSMEFSQAEEPEPVKAPERKPGEVSEAMKKKLRDEYVGLGGTPSKPMPSNLFLNICLFISAIAIMAKLSGVLG